MNVQLTEILKEIIKEMGITDVDPVVEISDDPKHGEYTTNLALRLAPMMKKGSGLKEDKSQTLSGKSPMEIALWVKERITYHVSRITHGEQDQNSAQQHQKPSPQIPANSVLQDVERIETAPPGFINFFLTEAKLGTDASEALEEKEGFGKTPKGSGLKEDKGQTLNKSLTLVKKRIVIEFTDPNPFKEFHIGHLYSNAVGESLARLLESQENTVRRVNYQGDVGMHVAKCLYGILQVQSSKFKVQSWKDVKKIPIHEKVEYLGEMYTAGSKAFEENEAAKKEIGDINKKIYAKDSTIYPLYEECRKWSLDYFEAIYKRLGTKFEEYYFESQVGEIGVALVREFLKKGVFEESEGAIVYRGEKHGLHTRVFINKLGLPTYEAKELGLAPTKEKDWPYDLSLIVTGNEINEYFKVLISAMSEIAPELGKKTRHVGHGMVRNADGGKMSSRSGQVLTGEGMLDEVKASIYKILDTSNQKYSKTDREEIAETAAIAAVKYSLLRVSLPSDVAFDMGKSVSFDGDSGPYLLYTYARCKSVLRKSEEASNLKYQAPNKQQASSTLNLNTEERSVLRLIHFFPEIVAEAASTLSPSIICNYLFKLAQAFNLFYQKHQILSSGSPLALDPAEGTRGSALSSDMKTDSRRSLPRSFMRDGNDKRLGLTAATAQTIKNGLYLLGISTVERM